MKSDAKTPSLTRVDLSQRASSVPVDWVIVLLPTALAVRTVSAAASLVVLGFLTVLVFMRKTRFTYAIRGGPFMVLIAAAAIVLLRPEPRTHVLFLVILCVLVYRLTVTVDARVIMASIIDGAGVYLIVNVIGYLAGIRSVGAADRIGGYVESSGFVRAIFPLSRSLDIAPSIASVYVAAAAFLIFERGWLRRTFRIVCFVAAFIVVSEAGARTALLTAIALPLVVYLFPFITRWLVQFLALFASVSALFLTSILSSVQSVAVPILVAIAPSRDTRLGEIASLNNRDLIWMRSLNYWSSSLDSTFDQLIGFGQNGQYISGASMTYADALAGTVRNSQFASMHNSFLQQLFDGGLVGCALLTLAIFWTGVRLSRRRRSWGTQGVAAIVAISALLVNGFTQATIAPGFGQEGFWLLVVFVGAACQSQMVEAAVPGEAEPRETTANSRQVNC